MRYGLVLLIGLGLAGQEKPPDAAPNPAADEARVQALAEYEAMRARAKPTAAGQYALALWCEKKGLRAEMVGHLTETVRLDPTRETAWKKLGFTRVRGRWLNPDEVADEAEQTRADKVWGPRLAAIHAKIHHKTESKRNTAEDDLLAIEDHRAVPSIYREFGLGGERDQLIAVQALGRIQAPLSSRLLALMSVYGTTPEVRRRAAESLRARDDRDYLPVLVALLVDPVKYEVRQVGGPGSPGAIFIEGKRFNIQRVYQAPAPDLAPRLGDLIQYDFNGRPVILRRLSDMFWVRNLPGQEIKPGGALLQVRAAPVARIDVQESLAEAQRAATTAQAQLDADVEALEEQNGQVKRFNDLVIAVMKQASGKPLGDEPDAWRDAVPVRKPYKGPSERPKPTFADLVPPAYVPRFAEVGLHTWLHAVPPH